MLVNVMNLKSQKLASFEIRIRLWFLERYFNLFFFFLLLELGTVEQYRRQKSTLERWSWAAQFLILCICLPWASILCCSYTSSHHHHSPLVSISTIEGKTSLHWVIHWIQCYELVSHNVPKFVALSLRGFS